MLLFRSFLIVGTIIYFYQFLQLGLLADYIFLQLVLFLFQSIYFLFQENIIVFIGCEFHVDVLSDDGAFLSYFLEVVAWFIRRVLILFAIFIATTFILYVAQIVLIRFFFENIILMCCRGRLTFFSCSRIHHHLWQT